MITLQIEIFLLIAIGYALSRLGMISSSTRSQLTNLSLDLILPCAIIQSFELDITWDQFLSALEVFFISIGIQLLYMLFNCFLWKKQEPSMRVNLRYGTLVSNAGFMGMPFAQGVFGSLGLMYASIFLIPQRVVMWSAGLSLYTKSDRKTVVRSVLTHPCIIALEIGVVVLLLRNMGILLPEALDKTISAIGSCNTAICMFVIGAILAEADKSDVFTPLTLGYSLIRLVVLPLVIWLVLHLLGITGIAAGVCVLESAMPAASTTAMLAARYDQNPAFASKLIFVSTLLSLLTLPCISWLITL